MGACIPVMQVWNHSMAEIRTRQIFQDWYETDLGVALLAKERCVLEQITVDAVGYYMLIQTPLRQFEMSGNLIRNPLLIAPKLELGAPKNTIVAEGGELPFDSDGVDVHVLHHTLELSQRPHDVLREAARTLLPSGRLIVVGFNPLSMWGIRRLLSKRKGAPWSAKFITTKRLEDWLKVAGLTLESVEYFMFRPPMSNPAWYRRWRWCDSVLKPMKLPVGGVYVMTATKQTRALITKKARWKRVPVKVTPLSKPIVKEIKD